MTIKETLNTATNRQWEEWDTGGGCTALVLNFDADNYIMLTDEGCMIPSTSDENLMVGLYVNGDYEGDIYYVSNLADALPIISNMIKQVQE